ncbi:hypothetical protein [Myxococcus sp. Y35]|uniref:hypothetical protein n=1 Tax=Pseudomyxococcus flavus TaxID=3115648 RepID=UPI003CF95EB9
MSGGVRYLKALSFTPIDAHVHYPRGGFRRASSLQYHPTMHVFTWRGPISIAFLMWQTGCAHVRESRTPHAPELKVVASQDAVRTFAHQVLDLEEELGTVTPAMRLLVDELEQAARSKIQLSSGEPSREQALSALKQMHDLLAERGFTVAPDGYVELLSQALSPVEVSGVELEALRHSYYTQGERARWLAEHTSNGGAVVYLGDCDTLAFLYMSMGDAIGLPLELVERPAGEDVVGHNWIQWTNKTASIGWDTLRAEEYSITTPLTRSQAIGYVQKLTAFNWKDRGNYFKAAERFKQSIQRFPVASTFNEYAWLLSTAPDPKVRDPAVARSLARVAVEKSCTRYSLGTLAAAHAAAGDFSQAVSIQRLAISRVPSDRPLDLADFKYRLNLYARGLRFVQAHSRREQQLRTCAYTADRLFKQEALSDVETAREVCGTLYDKKYVGTRGELEAKTLQRSGITIPVTNESLPASCSRARDATTQ